MNGQLNTQPLAELLHEISDARLSGALRLARERVKAAVYFDAGQVVAALMNLRAFRLVEIFRRGQTAGAARPRGTGGGGGVGGARRPARGGPGPLHPPGGEGAS